MCVEKDWDKWSPKLNQAIQFLVHLFDRGLSYSAINTARSALSMILHDFDGQPFGRHFAVCRILKGMYNRRPQRSRYASTWDVDIVLSFLRELSPLGKLSFKQLSMKLLLLMLLSTCQRVQTIDSLCISNIVWSENDKTVVFRLSKVLKHSKRGSLGILTLKSFDEDPRICVVRTLKFYLQKSSEIRPEGCDNLFIITTPPFNATSTQTIARWTRETLSLAGIDTELFKAHSVRGASTSKLSQIHVPVSEIMKKGSWSLESTFRKFYEKDILPKDVSHEMLSKFVSKQKT